MTGTISVLKVGTPDSYGTYYATLSWDLHMGDSSNPNAAWYEFIGSDDVYVSTL
jgi:hypothetical protein